MHNRGLDYPVQEPNANLLARSLSPSFPRVFDKIEANVGKYIGMGISASGVIFSDTLGIITTEEVALNALVEKSKSHDRMHTTDTQLGVISFKIE